MKSVLVVGTGTMGRGIAQVTAQAGLETRVCDVDVAVAERAVGSIASALDRRVEQGKLPAAERTAILGRLSATADLASAAEGIDLVIEAVPELMDVKVEVLAKVLASAPAGAIVGTNTSSLSVTELGRRLGAGERTVGLHFFNPPPVMPLLEIVRGLHTAEDVIARSRDLAERLGKTSILVHDSPGFATSRLGVAIGAEAVRMLEAGVASVEDIDRAMELGYRHPMGPLKLSDLVGLDVRLAILEHLHREVGEQFRPPQLLRQMVRAGWLGKKSGMGFYDWSGETPIARKL
jgi:3-hydroxybutyryl-CoA dehydrogenase